MPRKSNTKPKGVARVKRRRHSRQAYDTMRTLDALAETRETAEELARLPFSSP
jgi:hypothetical protein